MKNIKLLKKLLSAAVATALLLAAPAHASLAAGPDGFTDLPDEAHWSYGGIVSVIENGIMQGYGDGTFRPQETITLAEASAYLARAMGATEKADSVPDGITDYAYGSWYDTQGVVSIAHMMGILDGLLEAHGSISPDMRLTSEDAFDMMARAILARGGSSIMLDRFEDSGDISPAYRASLAALIDMGHVQGQEAGSGAWLLSPKDPITRARFATVLGRTFEQFITEAGTYGQDGIKGANVIISAPGVTLKDLTIDGDLIVGDGAGDGSVTLDGVRIGGRLVVRGGGSDSIIVRDSSISGAALVARPSGPVRVASEGSTIPALFVAGGNDEATLEGKFEYVVVEHNTPVRVRGDVEELVIVAQDAQVSLARNSAVGNATVNAENVGIHMLQGVSVRFLLVEGNGRNFRQTGSGLIREAEVRADAAFSRPPEVLRIVGADVTVDSGGSIFTGDNYISGLPETQSGISSSVLFGFLADVGSASEGRRLGRFSVDSPRNTNRELTITGSTGSQLDVMAGRFYLLTLSGGGASGSSQDADWNALRMPDPVEYKLRLVHGYLLPGAVSDYEFSISSERGGGPMMRFDYAARTMGIVEIDDRTLEGRYLGSDRDIEKVPGGRLIVLIVDENDVAFAAFVFGEGADRYAIAGVG